MNPDRDRILAEICASLRNDEHAPDQVRVADSDSVWSVVAEHGVGALLYASIMQSGTADRWPQALIDRLRRFAREQAALEMIRREELSTALNTLAAAGVECLLMKGAPLAYSHYASPEQRMRDDTDLLIRPQNRDAALEALAGIGYRRAPAIDGDLVMHQLQLHRTDRYGAAHVLDLHWRISNPHVFATTLGFDELAPASRPVEALGPGARRLGDEHALLLACVHRVAHHGASERLIWIYDIHLLVQRMDQTAAAGFADMAARKGMARVCADGVALSSQRFRTPGADALALALQRASDAAGLEPSARYLRAGRSEAAMLWDDLRALPDWRNRFKLIREHLFPSRAYMRERFGARSARQLPWLYVKRAAGAVRRLLRPRHTP